MVFRPVRDVCVETPKNRSLQILFDRFNEGGAS